MVYNGDSFDLDEAYIAVTAPNAHRMLLRSQLAKR